MEEARASWNTLYQSAEGFECQMTLRDDDERHLADRADAAMADISEAGGLPMQRRGYVPAKQGSSGTGNGDPAGSKGGNGVIGRNGGKRAKTYVDEEGVRCCNLTLVSGEVCGAPVTRREGRYGQSWACPDFRDHANRRD